MEEYERDLVTLNERHLVKDYKEKKVGSLNIINNALNLTPISEKDIWLTIGEQSGENIQDTSY